MILMGEDSFREMGIIGFVTMFREREWSYMKPPKEKAVARLYELLALQGKLERQFGNDNYNIFVFGSYLTTKFVEGKSDIDIAIYTENFSLYKKLALYLEEYFDEKGIRSDIFYIDTTMVAPIYCAPLKSEVQLTDYYPEKLMDFHYKCQRKLEEIKERMIG